VLCPFLWGMINDVHRILAIFNFPHVHFRPCGRPLHMVTLRLSVPVLRYQYLYSEQPVHVKNWPVSVFHSIISNTHTRLTAPFPGLPRWASTRKVKPIWILLKQETVSGSGISWSICKSAPRSRQITMPVPHHSVFYRPDALPAAQPTASKHWRPIISK